MVVLLEACTPTSVSSDWRLASHSRLRQSYSHDDGDDVEEDDDLGAISTMDLVDIGKREMERGCGETDERDRCWFRLSARVLTTGTEANKRRGLLRRNCDK